MRNARHWLMTIAALWCSLAASAQNKVEIEGIYYNLISGNKTAEVTYGSSKYSGYITIPSTVSHKGVSYNVTSIGNEAFANCSSLTTINIPEGVTSIGSYAFYNCSSLTAINIPESVTSIEGYAFADCSSLAAINIPESVTSIGVATFADCSRLTTINIPESVTSIGESAFYGCSSLAAITIPKNVTNIGENAFYHCSGLKTVINYSDLDIQKSGYNNNSYVAYYADRVINVDEFIGDYAFKTINGVHYLNGYIGNDTELTLPNNYQDEIYQIGEEAFYNCSSITAITIPKNSQLTSIGGSAFEDCSSLTSITIPESVTSIGNFAFDNCTALKEVIIEDGSETLSLGYNYYGNTTGQGLFYDCPLESVYLGRNLSYNSDKSYGYSPFYNKTKLTSLTIGDNVTSIGDYAFKLCSSITNITVAEDNTIYDSRDACNAIIKTSSNTLIAGCSATIIPESVTSIGDYAFEDCSSLTSITFPESVTNIGNYAFDNCTALKEVIIEDGSETLSLGYNFYGSSTGEGLFYDCPLESVYLGRNLSYSSGSSYGYSPFYNKDHALTNVTIGKNVTSIEGYTFFGSSLTSITIPESMTSIGESAFQYCSSLTAITIPESVMSIGNYAFQSCRRLTTINIPEGVTSIGEGAFQYCYGLTIITIPESVMSIGNYAFQSCSSLTTINIPESVTSIGNLAFHNCAALKEVTFGKGLKKIASDSFSECSSIEKITIHATLPPTATGNIFSEEVYENVMLYVPQGSVSKYQVMTGWSGFYNISEIEGGTPDYLTIRQADNGAVKIAVDLGRTYKVQIEPSEGWAIHSVTINGEDMTDQLDENYTFTTPTLTGSTVLNVAYEQIASKVKSAQYNNIKVRGYESTIFVDGIEQGDCITIYTASGTAVAEIEAESSNAEIAVDEGALYIVKVSDKIIKIQM